MAVLLLLSGCVHLVRVPEGWIAGLVASFQPGLPPSEVAYLRWIGSTFTFGACLVLLVLAVVWLERPARFREFFKLGPMDWKGLGLILLLTLGLNVAEAAFLRRMLFQPARQFLLGWGLWGRLSTDVGFTPDPQFAFLNTLLLLLVIWIEAPEEVFFRGYVQNHLQERVGTNGAVLAGAVIWDLWHLFAPAEFVRRLFYGLAYALVFRLRQNTTPLAIAHPLGNRLLMLGYVLGSAGRA